MIKVLTMKRKKINIQLLIIIFLCFIINCQAQDTKVEYRDYEVILDEGIYVEKFDSTNVSENRYTANNRTYLEGNKLTFDYYYEDLSGRKYKFQEKEGVGKLAGNEMEKAWFFVPVDSISENTISTVTLAVNYGLQPLVQYNPEYNQTIISYKYHQVNGMTKFNSATGLIENEMNIWMHPPRERFFRILELNPFPFIQAPYVIGTKWNWSLSIGSFWGDERWKTWDASIENQYNYEIVDKKKITLEIGEVDCYVIESIASSSIGKTKLTAYFNMEMGFVKLDYVNIDSTKTVLELIKFEMKEHKE